MIHIPLNIEQKEILDEALSREFWRKQKQFKRKRFSHFKDPKLKEIYDRYWVEHSPVLYTIPWGCHFSLYLYLILKSQVKFINWIDMPEYYRIAVSQDVNITKITRETGICKSTVRKAYRELVRFRIIEPTDYVRPYHKSTKEYIINE